MAGCCPDSPPSSALGAAFAEANGPESDIRRGESVECYMQRGGNTTGLHDDATENVLNKIDNTSIPITRTGTTATVSTSFRLTVGSTRVPNSWTMTVSPASTRLSLSVSGLLTGLWSASAGQSELGKTFKIQVTASDGSEIDTRGFTIAPTIGNENDEIRLINPLPGGIVNSKFGPRMHPILHVMKPHTGIDLKLSDRSVTDVVAACDGEIILAGGNPSTGYGLRVWIRHLTSSGSHICSTTYNHLNKTYVAVGQKVMAGQAIGKEGSTGASTGNHLHFEVKLPDGKFIDPEPLINGTLTVSNKTLPSGDADTGSLQTRSSKASLSETESKAKQASCEAFGPGYPAAIPPESTDQTPVVAGTDPFERAWFFTMQHEVGPHWNTTPQYSPGDLELEAGLIDTREQRKKDGYVNTANFPGGETKFGIAQKPNPGIKVTTATYSTAKNTGYNNYWKSSANPCTGKGSLIAVMLFDINYLHGPGNARKIYQISAVTSGPNDSRSTQLAACYILHGAQVQFINSIPRPEFTKGWLKRADELYAYVKNLPGPY